MIQTQLFFIVLLLSSYVPLAHATTFYERPFPDAVKDAPIVLRAKVGMSYGHWVHGNDGSKRLYTYYEMQVDEVLKGSAKGPTIIVREVGGEKDGVGMQVPGSAQFKRGEDVVVFANDERDKDGAYDLRGMMMGKYNVSKNEAGEEILTGAGLMGETNPALRGHDHVIHPEHFAEGNGHGDTSAPKWTLEKLRDLIKNQAAGSSRDELRSESVPVKVLKKPKPAPSSFAPKKFSTATVEDKASSDSEAPDLQSNTPSRPWSGVTVSLLAVGALLLGWFVRKALRR